MAEYDSIARGYSDSKRLPFRDHVERHTLLRTVGDVRGAHVLDLACGDGYYTRLLKAKGAASATGVDLSSEMIVLAEESERRRPLGCTYFHADAADFRPARPADVVVAAFLLNYARIRIELGLLCRSCLDSLRPGGRLVGLNDNPHVPPDASAGWLKYGFERSCDRIPLRDGDPIRYSFPTADGVAFGFTNYHHSPAAYEAAFREAGFRDFRWVPMALDPAQAGDPFWDDFLLRPPIIGFSATR